MRTVLPRSSLSGSADGRGAQAEPLAFAGFDRSMDIARLDRSLSALLSGNSPPAPTRAAINPGEWSAEFLRARKPGRYALRLPAEEARDHIYYVQADMRDGVIERLWLLLEKPLVKADRRHPTRSNEARYPACSDVLKPLTAKYGKPDALHRAGRRRCNRSTMSGHRRRRR